MDYHPGRTVTIYLSEKGIDNGEAEVFVQYQAHVSVHELLLDDPKSTSFCSKEKIGIHPWRTLSHVWL